MSAPPSDAVGRSPVLARILRLARSLIPSVGAPIEGFVERIADDELIGWAFDPARPDRRVLLVARLDGAVVAEGLANGDRPDLRAAGKGDGRHGFSFPLPSDLSADGREQLMVEAVSGWRRAPLERSGRFADTLRPSAKQAKLAASRNPTVGFIERCIGGVLQGWAASPETPEAPARVDIYEGERFLGTAVADIERPRLRQSDAPPGARGFRFALPADRDVDLDRLRARLAGTRLDLRRSKSYLRPPEGADADGPQPATLRPEALMAAVAPQPARKARTAFVICGEGSRAAFEASARAALEAGAEADAIAGLGTGCADAAGLCDLTGNEAALAQLLRETHTLCFLAPGQTVRPGLASSLLAADEAADVLCWGDGAAADDLDLAVRLGARTDGLAVRGHVFAGAPAGFGASLAGEGLDAVEAWTSEGGFSWARLAEPATTPRDAGRRAVPPPGDPLCRRVSLAVWSGWGQTAPPNLKALLAGLDGRHVEVLAPAELAPRLERAVRRLGVSRLASLALRPVEWPAGSGDAGVWRAMGKAATGQAVLFCAGEVRPAPGSVSSALAWALQPGIGGVTVRIEPAAANAKRAAEPAHGSGAEAADRPAAAAPALFAALSRKALAQVGGFPVSEEAPADVALALALRRAGRRSMTLSSHTAEAPPALAELWAKRVDEAPRG